MNLMINEPTVKCPKCGEQIKLTESLAAPMVERERQRLQTLVDAEKARADKVSIEAAAKLSSMEDLVTERVSAVKVEALAEAKRRAEADYGARFSELDNELLGLRVELTTKDTKLREAQAAQAEALRKERAVEERERELDLTVERQVTERVGAARQSALAQAEEAARLRLLEKETLIESMQKKVAELQQKIEQGSQQLQGEVQELDLESSLRTTFPFDTIGEVAKGVNGADVTQVVTAPSGVDCGTILYESKRTKNWSAGWLPKLREDGRRAKADILVLVSTALPDGVETFQNLDNVWVCAPRVAVPLATVLRASLLAVHATKQAQDGMRTKSEEVYAYVTGPQFRYRVEALVEAFTTMQDDLTAEQKAVQRQWAKRSVQIERVLTSTSGMFGDLQGIAGRALPAPEGLALSSGDGE